MLFAPQHQALSYNDTPILVGRVLRSAHKVEEEMIKMSERQELHKSSRDFLDTARSLAKGFCRQSKILNMPRRST